MMLYHLFALLWTNQFVVGFGLMVVASVCLSVDPSTCPCLLPSFLAFFFPSFLSYFTLVVGT
jgi:hypothetical protein